VILVNGKSSPQLIKEKIVSIEVNTTVVRTEGMMTAPVDNEIVILNMKGNNYISLDSIGRRIWEIIEFPVTVEDLCCRLGQEFEGTREQILSDVQPFLEELEREGLVRVAD
jgi:hypothetical protein